MPSGTSNGCFRQFFRVLTTTKFKKMYIPPRPKFTGDFFLAFGLAERQKKWDDEFTNMSKEKAIEAMKSGAKVAHYLFEHDEFVYMNGSDIIDERGIALPEFWENRVSESFENGWKVIPL